MYFELQKILSYTKLRIAANCIEVSSIFLKLLLFEIEVLVKIEVIYSKLKIKFTSSYREIRLALFVLGLFI